MKQILKRLEIIKASIFIEDEEIVDAPVQKLKSLPLDDKVKHILLLIENRIMILKRR
ncbi:MAG: hypothetical protein U9O65_03955 [Thermotogota bacterium]|nr:hypothetical protein [Thermotogota bacterium]